MSKLMLNALECSSPENPLLFLGSPGIGKTAVIEQWAAETGRELLVEHPVIAQSIDYRGLPAVVEGEAEWLPLGNLKAICDFEGPDTVVLFDDVGQSSPSVQAALMQLVWARKLGDMQVRDNVTFIMASNRVTDRSGVKPMLAALIGRCQVIDVEFDLEAWSHWAIRQRDVDARVVGYVKFRPDCFASAVPENPMQPFCTPRSLTSMAKLTAKGVDSLALLAGWVGMATAADFAAYAESIDKLPAIDKILSEPESVREITDPGLLHALVAQAARRVETRGDDIIRLSDTLKGGWGIQLISSACAVSPEFKKAEAFKTWARNHPELL